MRQTTDYAVLDALATQAGSGIGGLLSFRLLVVVVLVLVASVAAGGEDGGLVETGQSVRESGGEPSTSPLETAFSPDAWSSGRVELVGLTTLALTSVGVLVLLWRRGRLRLRARAGGARLEIEGRIALSTRHWVCVLRVDEKRLVVGVSGDGIRPLAILDDDPASDRAGRKPDRVRRIGGQAALERGQVADHGGAEQGSGTARLSEASRDSRRKEEGAFWFRPANTPGSGDEESSWENDLAPYRREVNRLRAMLQNWRESTEPGSPARDGEEPAT